MDDTEFREELVKIGQKYSVDGVDKFMLGAQAARTILQKETEQINSEKIMYEAEAKTLVGLIKEFGIYYPGGLLCFCVKAYKPGSLHDKRCKSVKRVMEAFRRPWTVEEGKVIGGKNPALFFNEDSYVERVATEIIFNAILIRTSEAIND